MLLGLIGLFAVATIVAEYGTNRLLVYATKPVTTLLIIMLPFFRSPVSHCYRRWIVIGLIFSLVGDTFLMWPNTLFLFGLIAFLLAQISYIVAFTRQTGWSWDRTFLLYLLFGIIVYTVLYPGLGDLALPVLVYITVILVMGYSALLRYRRGATAGILAVVGSLLFILSDTSLAFNRFYAPFDLSRLIVLGTYFPAQVFIALSAGKE